MFASVFDTCRQFTSLQDNREHVVSSDACGDVDVVIYQPATNEYTELDSGNHHIMRTFPQEIATLLYLIWHLMGKKIKTKKNTTPPKK